MSESLGVLREVTRRTLMLQQYVVCMPETDFGGVDRFAFKVNDGTEINLAKN
jgi:hypothetical protein